MTIKKCCDEIVEKGGINNNDASPKIAYDDRPPKMFYVDYDGGCFAIKDIKYCPYCSKRLELE